MEREIEPEIIVESNKYQPVIAAILALAIKVASDREVISRRRVTSHGREVECTGEHYRFKKNTPYGCGQLFYLLLVKPGQTTQQAGHLDEAKNRLNVVEIDR